MRYIVRCRTGDLAVVESIHEPIDSRIGAMTVTLILGVVTFVVSGGLAAAALNDMRAGSCTAALISLVYAIPLVLLTTIAFAWETVLGRQGVAGVRRSRQAGIALALCALPFWGVVAGVLSSVFGWG